MQQRRLLLLFGIALSAGCTTVRPTTGVMGLAVQPTIQDGRYTQALIQPYTRSSVQHLLVKLYRLEEGQEVPVMDDSTPIQADIPASDLDKPIRFEKLFWHNTYRIRAFAYRAAGTSSVDLISRDASSAVDVIVNDNDRPVGVNLPVQLIDQAFDGQGTGSIQLLPGGFTTLNPLEQQRHWQVSTFAGAAGQFGLINGVGTNARFDHLQDITSDRFGNLYVVDSYNYCVRKISPAGVVSTLFQYGINLSTGITVDHDGNVYVVDGYGQCVHKVTPQGVRSKLVGGVVGFIDGTGTAARFRYPSHAAVAPDGNLYVSDTDNHAIRKVTPQGVVTTLAGGGTTGFVDGSGTSALFNYPYGIAVTPDGNIYVADAMNSAIRKITPEGVVTTLRQYGYGRLRGLTSDSNGYLYAADPDYDAIHRIAPDGSVLRIAGGDGYNGVDSYADGDSLQAYFHEPIGVTVDPQGNIFVSEWGNSTIRKIQ